MTTTTELWASRRAAATAALRWVRFTNATRAPLYHLPRPPCTPPPPGARPGVGIGPRLGVGGLFFRSLCVFL